MTDNTSNSNCFLEAATGTPLQEKVFLKILQISQENTCVDVFLIDLQVLKGVTLLKAVSNKGVFLWNLQNFKNNFFEEHLRTTCNMFREKHVVYTGAAPRFPKWGGLEKHMFQKALSLVSPAGPTMIGDRERGKFLNSRGSRSLENATFFEYFLNYFAKILQ